MTHGLGPVGVTDHFVARAVERMGCTEDAAREIGWGVLWAIEHERRDLVEFVARVDRKGARVFRFRHVPTRRFWYALVDTNTMTCITLLPPGFKVGRKGKSKITLKEDDVWHWSELVSALTGPGVGMKPTAPRNTAPYS